MKRDRVKVQVNRVHEEGWGQNLKIFWIATTLFPVDKFKIGAHDGDEEVKTLWRDFEHKYKKKPVVLVVPVHEKDTDWTDTYTTSVINVKKTGFQLNCSRLKEKNWGMDLRAMAVIIP